MPGRWTLRSEPALDLPRNRTCDMTGDMPRDVTPDDAHSIAPDIAGDDGASAPANEGAAQGSVASAAFARGPNDPTVLPRLDHTAIRTIIAGIMLAMFLSALEQTIVAPALPAIGKSLANLDDLSWIVTAYLLAATAATPLFGKLTRHSRPPHHHAAGDRHFYRRLAGLCACTEHLDSGHRPRPAGDRRRRADPDRADHHCRPSYTARAPDGAELYIRCVHERQRSWPGARRTCSPIICTGRSFSGSICRWAPLRW